ncbi:MAG: (2Fe-2S)-binding protein [Actinomycetia bacterium]|nr:(2Fe-2S)-binding protein [Actinomycetes bacterium]
MESRDLDALVYPERVHRSIYVDPAIFAEEMTKIFGGIWVYLAHESQIPEPNDFTTTELGRRPLIITRAADGEIHALINRCAHRASTVCQTDCGNAKRFTCGYHGWTYGNDGALVGLPYPKGYPDSFDRDAHGLRGLPRVESYRGFVFGSLNPEVGDLVEWLGAARPYLDYFIDRAPGGRIEVRNKHRLSFAGNWKLAWDNAGDGLHATYAHKSFAMLNEERYGGGRSLSQFKHTPDDTGMFGEDLGHGHIFVDQRPGITGSFWETQRPIPGKETAAAGIHDDHEADAAAALLEAAPGSMINLSIFPNLLIKGNQLEILTPRSVDRSDLHLWVCAAPDAPDEVNTLRMRIAEDFPTFGNPDDIEIYERCQRGLQIEEVEWCDTSKGIGLEDVEMREGSEVRRSAVTYETPIRGYLREWKRLMASDPKITTV